jgi:predicted transcriptional regulator
MAMALKRKKLTISEKVKIIQEVEKNPTVSRNEIAKYFGLPPSSLSNIILWKASILEEESRCGAHSEKRKNMKTSPNKQLETSFQI